MHNFLQELTQVLDVGYFLLMDSRAKQACILSYGGMRTKRIIEVLHFNNIGLHDQNSF